MLSLIFCRLNLRTLEELSARNTDVPVFNSDVRHLDHLARVPFELPAIKSFQTIVF